MSEGNYSLLRKALADWPEESERPPLLINGLDQTGWDSLKDEIIKAFANKTMPANHPDILILESDVKKQNIEVKQTRDFISQLSLSGYELPFRLGLIPFAHQLNIQSQNALLKTLEEPLKNRYLILGTDSKNKLLPTILSRATIINLRTSVETGHLPVRQAGTPSLHEEIISFYQDCLKSSAEKRLQKSQVWSEGKNEKIIEFFDLIIPALHAKLLTAVKNKDRKNISVLTEQLKKALDYSEQLQRTSGASPKLLFESFLLRI